MRRILVPLALALFLLSCRSAAEKNNNEETDNSESPEIVQKEKIAPAQLNAYKNTLSAFFDSLLLKRNFNGGVIVAKGGNILYEAYSGYTDPQKKTDTITSNTAFHLASTSKPFTGVAVMKLVEKGKLSLDDDIIKYFSGFPYSGVTVRDLLTHRSGLPNYLYFMDDKEKWNQNIMVTNKDVLDFMIKYQPAKSYAPGTRFNYCNTNYVLLALIVEKVTGTPFPQYMKQTIFEPLGMNHTYIYTRADSARSIMSYKPSGALWANDKYEYTYGDKNIYSTPQDMFKWDSALYREDFISKTTLDSSFVPRSLEKPSIHNYGYGWRMLNLKNGKNVIYHFGKWHGFTPAFARLIDEKVVIIILGNRYSQSMYEAAKHAYDIFGDYMKSDSGITEEEGRPTGPVNENPTAQKKEPKPEAAKAKIAVTPTPPVKKKQILPVEKPKAAKPATAPKKSDIKKPAAQKIQVQQKSIKPRTNTKTVSKTPDKKKK